MADKVEKIGIKRESNWQYYINGTDVWRTQVKTPSNLTGKEEIVSVGNFKREDGYLYYIDRDGDISRAGKAKSVIVNNKAKKTKKHTCSNCGHKE
jgi:hypothetical protein